MIFGAGFNPIILLAFAAFALCCLFELVATILALVFAFFRDRNYQIATRWLAGLSLASVLFWVILIGLILPGDPGTRWGLLLYGNVIPVSLALSALTLHGLFVWFEA